jgi:hypothetical protein
MATKLTVEQLIQKDHVALMKDPQVLLVLRDYYDRSH